MTDLSPCPQAVANWMIARSYATGHGDTIEDMLGELEWQARERGSRDIWQPIESAPRDGTKIDLLYPHPRGRFIDAFLDETLGWVRREPRWGPGSVDPLPEEEWAYRSLPNMLPTHWMPLPSPPREAAGPESLGVPQDDIDPSSNRRAEDRRGGGERGASASRSWPLIGYAPGDYLNRCTICGEGFTGDKRAIHCIDCAAARANELLSASTARLPDSLTVSQDALQEPPQPKAGESETALSGEEGNSSSVAGLPAHVASATATDTQSHTGKED